MSQGNKQTDDTLLIESDYYRLILRPLGQTTTMIKINLTCVNLPANFPFKLKRDSDNYLRYCGRKDRVVVVPNSARLVAKQYRLEFTMIYTFGQPFTFNELPFIYGVVRVLRKQNFSDF